MYHNNTQNSYEKELLLQAYKIVNVLRQNDFNTEIVLTPSFNKLLLYCNKRFIGHIYNSFDCNTNDNYNINHIKNNNVKYYWEEVSPNFQGIMEREITGSFKKIFPRVKRWFNQRN